MKKSSHVSPQDLENIIAELESEMADLIKKSEEEVLAELNSESIEESNEVENTESEEIEKNEESEELEASEENEEEEISTEDFYSNLDKSEQEAHFNVLKGLLFGNEESQEIKKSEDSDLLKNEINDLKKSNDSLVKDNEELKKSLDTVSEILNKILKAPQKKAISSEFEVIAKSSAPTEEEEDFSKLSSKEISNRIVAKQKAGNLTKSDRDLIDAFYYNQVGIDKIKHLLKN